MLIAGFLSIFLGSAILNLKVVIAVWLLRLWMIFALLWAVRFLYRFLRTERLSYLIFWVFVSLVLFMPGAYLEYPGDPWEHIRRIFEWSSADNVRDHRLYSRFAYLIYYSWLSCLPISHVRWGYAFINGAIQLLVVVSFYSLVRRWFGRQTSFLQVVAFLAFFGTSVFGLRYYVLAPTALAMCFYFWGLAHIVDIYQGKAPTYFWAKKVTGTYSAPIGPESRRALFCIVLSLIGTFFNHRQEFRFLILATGVLLFAKLWTRYRKILPKSFLAIPFICILLSKLPFVQSKLFRFGTEFVTQWGSLAIWHPALRITSTWAIPGVTGLVACPLFLRNRPELCLLTLTPLIFFLFPPTVALLLVTASDISDVYRLCYFFPSSIVLTCALQSIAKRLFSNMFAKAFCLIVIVGLGSIPQSPIFGRLPFQLYRVPPQLSMGGLEDLIDWLNRTRKYETGSFVLTDDATSFGLYAYGIDQLRTDRIRPPGLIREIFSADDILKRPNSDRVCSAIAKISMVRASSWVGRLSGHWVAEGFFPDEKTVAKFSLAAKELVSKNWAFHTVGDFEIYDRLKPIDIFYKHDCFRWGPEYIN